MESFLANENAIAPKRSQFLKVLCILSFVMCGLGFVQGVLALIQNSPETKQQQIEQIKLIKPEMADLMENELIELQKNPYSKIAPYLNLLYIFLSFLGVFMMWNLNKIGFYIYSIAEILPHTAYLFIGKSTFGFANSIMPGGASFAMAGIVIVVAIDLVFVGLYAKCQKEMVN